MKNIRPSFEVWERDISEFPPGYQKITCHMIFDVKIGKNFMRKWRFVTDGNKTKTPESMTYLSVVSRDSVCITLKIAALPILQGTVESGFEWQPSPSLDNIMERTN